MTHVSAEQLTSVVNTHIQRVKNTHLSWTTMMMMTIVKIVTSSRCENIMKIRTRLLIIYIYHNFRVREKARIKLRSNFTHEKNVRRENSAPSGSD